MALWHTGLLMSKMATAVALVTERGRSGPVGITKGVAWKGGMVLVHPSACHSRSRSTHELL